MKINELHNVGEREYIKSFKNFFMKLGEETQNLILNELKKEQNLKSKEVKIGCSVCAYYGDYIVGLRSDRGITLPGGKLEPGETFRDCARREFKEETGMDTGSLSLMWHGLNDDGFYVYCYGTRIQTFTEFISNEGITVLCGVGDLLKSQFKSYYLEVFG